MNDFGDQDPSNDDYSGFDVDFPVVHDDGPSPGNETPSDAIPVRIEIEGNSQTEFKTVHNVKPIFQHAPSLSFETASDGTRLAVVTVALWDAGRFDTHTAEAAWADGTTTEAEDLLDETDSDYIPTTLKTIRIERELPDESVDLLPLTVTLTDDDTGESSYVILESDLARNNDDDNENDQDDFLDVGFAEEDDLVALSLSDLPETTGDGYLSFSYDSTRIRLWDSPLKQVEYFPENQTADDSPLAPDATIWVEGLQVGVTAIQFGWNLVEDQTWHEQNNIPLGGVNVTVWGVDLDIDSDNDNGFGFPDNSLWEEHIEDHEYSIGKLVFHNASNFTPVRLRLPPNLSANDPELRIKIDLAGDDEMLRLWNLPKAHLERDTDPTHTVSNDPNDAESGNVVEPSIAYSLSALNYEATTGGITLWAQAIDHESSRDKKTEIDDVGKAQTKIEATILGTGLSNDPLDRVRYVAVESGDFYDVFLRSENRQIRNAFPADFVYGPRGANGTQTPLPNSDPIDDPNYAVKKVEEDELESLLRSTPNLTDDEDKEISFILDTIYYRHDRDNGETGTEGFRAALFRDYNSGDYTLAYQGTNFNELPDWIENVGQGLAGHSRYYVAAQLLADHFYNGRYAAPIAATLQLTGQSLGGGLASAGAVAAGDGDYGIAHADTYNASGLNSSAFITLDPDPGGFTRDQDEDGIFDNADVDLTGGVDANENGIDDRWDVSLTGGADADGDGVDDSFKPGEYVDGSLANFAVANTWVDSYQVWYDDPNTIIPGMMPDTVSAPDGLSWIQLHIPENLMPSAVGDEFLITGVEQLTVAEQEFLNILGPLLNGPNTGEIQDAAQYIWDLSWSELRDWLNSRGYTLPDLNALAGPAQSALSKIGRSHGFTSIYHGLMTNDFWQIYE